MHIHPIVNSSIQFLALFFRKNSGAFLGMGLSIISYSLLHASFPYLIGRTIDKLAQDSLYQISFEVGLIIGTWLLMEMATRTLGVLSVKTYPKYRSQIREYFYCQTSRYSQKFFLNNPPGDIGSKITEIAKISEETMEILIIKILGPVIYFVIYSFTLYNISVSFMLCLHMLIVTHIAITVWKQKVINKSVEKYSQASFALRGYLVDYLTTIFTVKIYNRNNYEKEIFDKYQGSEALNYKKFLWASEVMNVFKSLASFLFILVAILLALKTISVNQLTIGDISLLFLISLSSTTLTWKTSQETVNLFFNIGTIHSIIKFFRQEEANIDQSAPFYTNALDHGKVNFHNMTFCYDTSFHLFEKFNLTIYPGEKVGIIGPTGSGKSTLFKLLLNLMQPQHGKILFNNQDIKTFSNDGIRECITFIPQDPSLFQRSIFDNILYGRPNAKKEEVFHAAKVAQCSHFIESLPNGYQFVVGDKGQKLSGGQRQLIAVARAILKNTNLWLIDEATSSLDVENEFQLHTALSTILSDKTVLVIAHRLSTLRHVDRIIKIENGKITADGPPSEILNHIPFPSIHDDRVNLF